MSDTPIQDSITVDKYSHLPMDVQQTVRELERENVALKQALDAQMKYQRELRADRDRLDYLWQPSCSQRARRHLRKLCPEFYYRDASMRVWRAAIDAAMGKGKL